MIFSSYSISVDAAALIPTATAVYSAIRFVYAAFGISVDDDFMTSMAANDSYKAAVDNLMNSHQIYKNENGTITFSEEAMTQLRTLFDEYLASTPEAVDVIWMPVITEKNLKASWFHGTESYYMAMSVLEDHELVGLYRDYRMSNGSPVMDYYAWTGEKNVYTPVYIDLSDVSIHFNTVFNDALINSFNYLTTTFGHDTVTNPAPYMYSYFVDKTGIGVSPVWYGNVGSGWTSSTDFLGSTFTGKQYRGVYNPFFGSDLRSTDGFFNYFVLVASSKSNISYVPLFSNANAYKDWVTGNGSYYRFDSGYTGGDITINPDADYSAITDAIQDVMKQSIANGDTMAKMLANMQTTFAKVLADISGSLGDIGDNTAETNSWLEKIYELLEDQQTELQEYFESSGRSLDDLIGLLSHTGSDGKVTSVYHLLADLLLLFRVQQEDLQAYMADAQNFFKTLPVKIGVFFKESTQDIIDAIQEVVDAIDGIRINIDYGDVDGSGSGDSESLWKMLGEGIGKILTSILGLLKTLIFKGLDALIYLVGVVGDNITAVFEDMEVYVDRVCLRFEGDNALLSALGGAIPQSLSDMLVIFIFFLIVCAVFSYLRR